MNYKLRIKTYHGTDGRYLPKILEKGILAQSPNGKFDKGVYMTSEIEKAARYAVDGIEKTHGIPIILEISISTDRKINKIYRDKLDRDEDHLNEENDNYNEDLESLNRDIKYVIETSIPNTHLNYQDMRNFQLDLVDNDLDLSSLRGINVYKNVLNYARSKNANIEQVKRTLFSTIPPNRNYGNIIISEDGTIKIDTSEIENMHQQIYPKTLPPSVIKAVWISNVPKEISGERMHISSKLLPQESRAIFDTIRNLCNKYLYDAQKGELDEDKIENLIDALDEINSGGWFDDDINTIKSSPSSIENILLSLGEFADENWYDGLEGKGAEFTRMEPKQALQYINNLEWSRKMAMNYKNKIWTRLAAGDNHDWGCLMIDFPEELAEKCKSWAKENVKDENLFKDDGHGLETHIHTTVAYGIAQDTDRNKVKEFVESIKSPVKVELGKISKFDTNEKFDVIKVEVESEELHKLHKRIEDEIGIPGNTFPDYKPHLTLAYVLKNSSDDLIGEDPFAGEKFELTQFDYSCPEKKGEKDTYSKYTINEEKKAHMNYKHRIIVKAGPTLGKPNFDFATYQEKASRMSNGELYGAIKDINETLRMIAQDRAKGLGDNHNTAEGWYADEKSVYVMELNKRGRK